MILFQQENLMLQISDDVINFLFDLVQSIFQLFFQICSVGLHLNSMGRARSFIRIRAMTGTATRRARPAKSEVPINKCKMRLSFCVHSAVCIGRPRTLHTPRAIYFPSGVDPPVLQNLLCLDMIENNSSARQVNQFSPVFSDGTVHSGTWVHVHFGPKLSD